MEKATRVIEEVRARISRETGRAVEVISATRPAMMVSGCIGNSQPRHTNYVIDPASLQVDRRARESDRSDRH